MTAPEMQEKVESDPFFVRLFGQVTLSNWGKIT
jgi:hypothetical protein